MVYAVVPGYYLVWYNLVASTKGLILAVVPGYYLVWYNKKIKLESKGAL